MVRTVLTFLVEDMGGLATLWGAGGEGEQGLIPVSFDLY